MVIKHFYSLTPVIRFGIIFYAYVFTKTLKINNLTKLHFSNTQNICLKLYRDIMDCRILFINNMNKKTLNLVIVLVHKVTKFQNKIIEILKMNTRLKMNSFV